MYKIILASGSPRRRELLAHLDLPFEVRVIDGVEESYPSSLPVRQIPEHISQHKAEAYKATMADDELVITCDTIVALDGKVYGKPADEAAARRMLGELSGRTHEVITGVTLTTANNGSRTFHVVTQVTFAKLSQQEIAYYVSAHRPMDKAGAYGIQEWIGAAAVEGINGSFYNVMGLPLHRLYQELKAMQAISI